MCRAAAIWCSTAVIDCAYPGVGHEQAAKIWCKVTHRAPASKCSRCRLLQALHCSRRSTGRQINPLLLHSTLI